MKCPSCGHSLKLVSDDGAPSAGSEAPGELAKLMASVYDDELSEPFEIEFMQSLRPRFEQYGDRTKMSPKQWNVLRKIAAK